MDFEGIQRLLIWNAGSAADEGMKAREKAIAAAEEEAAQLLYRALKAEEAAGGAAVPFKTYIELKKAYQKARQDVRVAVRAAARSRGRRVKHLLVRFPSPISPLKLRHRHTPT